MTITNPEIFRLGLAVTSMPLCVWLLDYLYRKEKFFIHPFHVWAIPLVFISPMLLLCVVVLVNIFLEETYLP